MYLKASTGIKIPTFIWGKCGDKAVDHKMDLLIAAHCYKIINIKMTSVRSDCIELSTFCSIYSEPFEFRKKIGLTVKKNPKKHGTIKYIFKLSMK